MIFLIFVSVFTLSPGLIRSGLYPAKKSLLKVNPHSGRTNQIRLHFAVLGLPIIGDLGYKNSKYFENNPLTYPDDSLFLHAWRLEFTDVDLVKKVRFEVEVNVKWNPYLNL